MYTGTLIEDLIAVVERAGARAGAVEMHKVRTETGIAAEDLSLANAHIRAVPSGAAGQFGQVGSLA